MIDFHSHFLPYIDDGSKSFDETFQMLELSYVLGIDTMVSTSHYSTYYESIEDFLKRRNAAIRDITETLHGKNSVPQIVGGAEVEMYSGMSSDQELSRLCIGNTNYMLIEMPYGGLSSLTERELLSIMRSRRITPIIAHIDRYIDDRASETICGRLLDFGAVAQINGDSIINQIKRKKVLKLIRNRKNVLLGSDCHNMEDRRPNLDEAIKVIENNLGKNYVDTIDYFGNKILEQ